MPLDLNEADSTAHPGPPPSRYDGSSSYRRWYRAYLSSSDWALKRDAVMERAEGLCEGCRARPATEIHHLSYDHVGDEFLWELAAVCRPCHDRWHAGG